MIENLIGCNNFVDYKSLANYIILVDYKSFTNYIIPIIQKIIIKAIIGLITKRFATYINAARKITLWSKEFRFVILLVY